MNAIHSIETVSFLYLHFTLATQRLQCIPNSGYLSFYLRWKEEENFEEFYALLDGDFKFELVTPFLRKLEET